MLGLSRRHLKAKARLCRLALANSINLEAVSSRREEWKMVLGLSGRVSAISSKRSTFAAWV